MIKLSYKTWDNVFVDKDVDTIFNSFLNTYLRIFYSSFPIRKIKAKSKKNPWITHGITIFCFHKRELYLDLMNSNDPNLKRYYKIYCKILTNVTKSAKKLYYIPLISNSNHEIKTTWNTTKSVTGKKTHKAGIESLNIEGKLTDNHHTITNFVNNYFLTIADKINTNHIILNSIAKSDRNNHLKYLSQSFMITFPKIKFNHTSTTGIENIIKSLKPNTLMDMMQFRLQS